MEFRDMRRKRQQLSDEESIGILQKATSGTLEHGLARMLAIRLDIEHLTGKEAIELMKQREQHQACLDPVESPMK